MQSNNDRPTKILYYLGIAKTVSERSTCINKKWGAVIVKDDSIISTGYNGAPRGRINCSDRGVCYRLEHNIPRGTHYESCRSVHAEANAIIPAHKFELLHSTMYLYGFDVVGNRPVSRPDCCLMCRRLIINAGIDDVVFADLDGICADPKLGFGYRIVAVSDWVRDDDSLTTDVDSEGY